MAATTHPAAHFRPHDSNPAGAFRSRTATSEVRTAIVFLDTNVLLAPYRNTKEALEAIRSVYELLCVSGRLVVPAQAAREFARNRPVLVSQLHRQVVDARTYSMSGRFDAPAILHALPQYAEVRDAVAEIDAGLKKYRKGMDELLSSIAGWQTSDPILQVYEALFTPARIVECGVSDDDLESIRKQRFERQLPPGFRDKGKDDGGVGDLAIWLTILMICADRDADAILVTEDSKDDWFHRSGDKRLFPRYELLEEFGARVPGRAFSIFSLSQLLAAHGAPRPVVDQLATQEALASSQGLVPLRGPVEFIVSRLAQVTSLEHISVYDVPTDIRVQYGKQVIWIFVVACDSADELYSDVDMYIRRAQGVAEELSVAGVVVAFSTASTLLASKLTELFLRDRFQGARVGIVVLEERAEQFLCRICQTDLPGISGLFPVTTR